jgi:hypothetical protein
MFAPKTPQREHPITPYLNPNAAKDLQRLFFGPDKGPKRSRKHMRKWCAGAR